MFSQEYNFEAQKEEENRPQKRTVSPDRVDLVENNPHLPTINVGYFCERATKSSVIRGKKDQK